MTDDDSLDDYDEWQAQQRAARPAAGSGYARFVVHYQLVVVVVLLVSALLLTITGNGDTAVLFVALAVVAGLWGLLHRRYTAR